MTELIRRGDDAEADTEQDSGEWRVGRTGSSLITVVLILIISLTQACTTSPVGDPNWCETLRTNPNALRIRIDETQFSPYMNPLPPGRRGHDVLGSALRPMRQHPLKVVSYRRSH